MRSFTEPDQSDQERGVALIELLIVSPVLIFLLLSTFEVGRALHQYMILQQIAYEGARAGSQITVSPENKGCLTEFVSMSIHGQTASKYIPHQLIQERVRVLLNLQEEKLSVSCDSNRFPLLCAGSGDMATQPTISSELILNEEGAQNCGLPAEGTMTFAVRVSGIYTPLVFPVSFPISSEARAPVLVANNDQFVTGVPDELPNAFPIIKSLPPVGDAGGMVDPPNLEW